jgi:peptidoglycan hydrolase-like protein with peptidoglycan-binding domain
MRRRTALAAGVAAVAAGGLGGWRWLDRPDAATSATAGVAAATAEIRRADLSAREQVPGTMGYVGDWRLVHPGPPGVLTAAAAPATVVTRGQRLYEVDGRPVVLLYGTRPVWREFRPGMAPGEDVRQLEQNLAALGFTGSRPDNRFTAATAAAVRRWQQRLGRPRTGRLALGSLVFAPGAVRVVEALVPPGAHLGGGPVLRASSTRRAIAVALPTDRQGQVRVAAPVEVTLPSGQRVAATVADVGRVATSGAAGTAGGTAAGTAGGTAGGPPPPATIAVTVTLDQAAEADGLDQAPVQVAITTARRTGVLAAPVTALRAAAGAGAYEITVVDGDRRRALPVRPGLFDERAGLIEIIGDGVAEGMRVEVPRDDATGL